jgi:hypothetical protein
MRIRQKIQEVLLLTVVSICQVTRTTVKQSKSFLSGSAPGGSDGQGNYFSVEIFCQSKLVLMAEYTNKYSIFSKNSTITCITHELNVKIIQVSN